MISTGQADRDTDDINFDDISEIDKQCCANCKNFTYIQKGDDQEFKQWCGVKNIPLDRERLTESSCNIFELDEDKFRNNFRASHKFDAAAGKTRA